MRALVLSRSPFGSTNYAQVMGPEWQVSVIGDDRAIRQAESYDEPYDQLVAVPDYNESPAVELAAHRLHRRRPFDTIVALSEYDVLRAARLRELLGIPGQSLASALAYRDKLVMKETLAAAGVPVTRFAAVTTVSDLLGFAERTGYPFIVKPRRGAGSVGVELLRDEADVQRVAMSCRELGGDVGAALLAEEYVPNSMLHVDGLVHAGKVQLIWPSTHGDTTTLSYRDGGALVSSMLDRDDPRWEPSVALVEQTLAALPTPDTTIFHAEVFHTPDGRWLLNEIASRMGGVKVGSAMKMAFGVSLGREYLRALATGEMSFAAGLQPSRLAGWLVVPPIPGRVRRVPTGCPLDGVHEFAVHTAVGTEIKPATSAFDALMTAVAVGDDRATVLGRLEGIRDWFHAELKIEPVFTSNGRLPD
ncbi:hypothetical protein [Actinoplanes sp. NPDC049599]|uniref:ATP-binding protein n=1 Tax=Actinoplanes sp. NPDC049599 TaxID=3363903 RepID=UPI003796A327